jgi:hypothetical protein
MLSGEHAPISNRYLKERKMKWEKGKDFVRIVSGISANSKGEVWYVESSLGFENLPIEWRNQVPKTDEQAYEKLEASVSSWAERHGYQLVASDTP